jgi:hypothetical protein
MAYNVKQQRANIVHLCNILMLEKNVTRTMVYKLKLISIHPFNFEIVLSNPPLKKVKKGSKTPSILKIPSL